MGDWQIANRLFLKCKKQKPEDVHVKRLMSFMVCTMLRLSIAVL